MLMFWKTVFWILDNIVVVYYPWGSWVIWVGAKISVQLVIYAPNKDSEPFSWTRWTQITKTFRRRSHANAVLHCFRTGFPPNTQNCWLEVWGTLIIFLKKRFVYDPWRQPHPILSLNGFDISHLKWCSMHALNLGVLQFVTGSSIDLLCSLGAPALWKAKFCFPVLAGIFRRYNWGSIYIYIFQHLLPHPGFFGSLHLPLDQHLRICSARFRKWASVNCIEYLTQAWAGLFLPDPKLYCYIPGDAELVWTLFDVVTS